MSGGSDTGDAGDTQRPDLEELPAWLAEVVVLAEHARAILRRQVAPIIGGCLVLVVAGWAGLPALPWAAGGMALAAGLIGMRNARAPQGADLRAGAWSGIVLLVLDMVVTPWGLGLLAGLHLGGGQRPLLHAATCTVIASAVGTAGLLARLVGPSGSSRRAGLGAWERTVPWVVVLALGAALVWLLTARLSWWWVGAIALGSEAGTLLTLRAGARAESRPAEAA
ncbi:hypothetical protein ACSL103130_10505 [Actinomyces slackii]|uniref:Uncharacterized protein n=1 Tax=Actinomyces slackii TaxID=52774 RepID=A0A448KAA9_9ACTO|nr:hypothetical protein [Actinomyces slackii]VEG73859.1 Uncharacterised protein [Actinomyces slackii]